MCPLSLKVARQKVLALRGWVGSIEVMLRRFAWSLGFVALGWSHQAQAVPAFGPEELKSLSAGEVLVKRVEPKGGEGMAAKAVAIVNAQPDTVWSVINDCAHFSEFMPRTKTSEELDGGQVCHVEVSMPFPISNLWSKTRVLKTFLEDGGRMRTWFLLEGTYDHLNGSWTVYPWEGGKRTLLLYKIDADPNVPIPDGVLQSLSEGALPDTFQAVRDRSKAKCVGTCS